MAGGDGRRASARYAGPEVVLLKSNGLRGAICARCADSVAYPAPVSPRTVTHCSLTSPCRRVGRGPDQPADWMAQGLTDCANGVCLGKGDPVNWLHGTSPHAVRTLGGDCMFADRKSLQFPGHLSAWWIPLLLALGWVPLCAGTVMLAFFNPKALADFAPLWVWLAATPCTLLAAASVFLQLCRLWLYFRSGPARIQP